MDLINVLNKSYAWAVHSSFNLSMQTKLPSFPQNSQMTPQMSTELTVFKEIHTASSTMPSPFAAGLSHPPLQISYWCRWMPGRIAVVGWGESAALQGHTRLRAGCRKCLRRRSLKERGRGCENGVQKNVQLYYFGREGGGTYTKYNRAHTLLPPSLKMMISITTNLYPFSLSTIPGHHQHLCMYVTTYT